MSTCIAIDLHEVERGRLVKEATSNHDFAAVYLDLYSYMHVL